jgi:hypothetical protein
MSYNNQRITELNNQINNQLYFPGLSDTMKALITNAKTRFEEYNTLLIGRIAEVEGGDLTNLGNLGEPRIE